MRFKSLTFLACLLAATLFSRADDKGAVLRAVATTDYTEVHPDGVFDVTLSLENPTDVVQKITIPDPGWDRVWKSSNHHVTWDFWDSDFNDKVTIEIQPHGTYVFPKPLKMFIDQAGKKTRMEFRMGYKTGGAFSKTLWSNPITLDVTP
jgi:hypothetical protein